MMNLLNRPSELLGHQHDPRAKHRSVSFREVLGMVGCMVLAVACGGPKETESPSDRKLVEAEFRLCQTRERVENASECWRNFLYQYGDRADSAERAYATDHLFRQAGPDPKQRPSGDRSGGSGGSGGGGGGRPVNEPPQPHGSDPGVSCRECNQGFQPSADSRADVIRLGQMCRGPCGVEPFNEVASDVQQASDSPDVFGIQLQQGYCYIFFAAGGRDISDLDAILLDPNDDVVKEDKANDNWPSFMYCPTQTGRHRFVVSVAAGGGTYHYQVWQRRER